MIRRKSLLAFARRVAASTDTAIIRKRQQVRTGSWYFASGQLVLSTQTGQRSFKVNFFRAGVLSLEEADGTAMLYHKAATNVVPIGGS